MITNFSDFYSFLAKKWAFFFKKQCRDPFFATFLSKKAK
jgi:hypothetical protein